MDDPLAGLDSWENATPKQSEDPLAGLVKWEDARPDKFRDQDRREQGAREWAVKTGGGDAPIDQVMRGIGFENANKTGPFGIRPRDLTMPFQGAVTALGRAVTGKDSEAELMKKADDAYEKGDATDEQLARRAIREYEQNRNQQLGSSGRIAQGVAGSGAVLGEALVGGAAVKAAGGALGVGEAATGIGRMAQAAGTQALATPLTPSMWLKDAEERQSENGGALLSPKNAGLPMVRAAFTNAIMGHLGKVGEGKGILKQIAIGAGGMPTEMAAADTLAGFGEDMFVKAGMDAKLKTSTGYGTIGMLAEGKYGPAMEKIAVEAILGGMNSVFHGKETKQLESFKEAVDHLEAAGIPADTAGKVLQDAIPKSPEDLPKSPVKDFVESMKPEESPKTAPAEAKPESTQSSAEGEKSSVPKPDAVDPVKEAVQKAVGPRMEDVGEGVYTVSHGDRFLSVSPAGKDRVSLNFDYNEAKPGSLEQAPSKGLQPGTKSLMIDVANIAKELAHTGKEIEYTASPVKGEGGRTSRADLYGRMLEKAGYEQIEKKGDSYVWKPKPETVEVGQIQNGTHPLQMEAKNAAEAAKSAGVPDQAITDALRRGQEAGYAEGQARIAADAKGIAPVETPPRKGLGKRPVNPPSAPPGNDAVEGSRPGEKATQSQDATRPNVDLEDFFSRPSEPKAAEKAFVRPDNPDLDSIMGKPLSPDERKAGQVGGGSPEAERATDPALHETALANAKVDEERAKNHLPPLMSAARKANAEVWDAAMLRIGKDKNASSDLVNQLAKKSRTTDVEENALLLHRKIVLSNEYERTIRTANDAMFKKDTNTFDRLNTRADELLGQIDQLDKVTRSTGTDWGRSGQFRKQLAAEDYSLGRMMNEATRQKREPLTPEEKQKVVGLHEEISRLQERLKDLEKPDPETPEPIPPEPQRSMLGKISDWLGGIFSKKPGLGKAEPKSKSKLWDFADQMEKDAAKELMQKFGPGKLFSGFDPTSIAPLAKYTAAKIIKTGLTFTDFSKQITAKFGDVVKPHLNDIWNKAQEHVFLGKMDATDLRVDLTRKKSEYNSMVEDFKQKNRSVPEKIFGTAKETNNAVRAFITAYDLSAVLRQGGMLSLANPTKVPDAAASMLKSALSPRFHERAEDLIRNRPNGQLYEKSGLYLSDNAGPATKQEEAFIGKWVKKIPGVAASERAFSGYLNRMRADVFDSLTASLARDGKPKLEEAKAIANYVNKSTGRGTLPGKMDQAAAGLAQVFFSPRYLASRFQILSGQPFYGGTMRTRGLIAKEYAKAAIGLGVVYAVAKALSGKDVDITFDPRSADFGKMKFGNMRVDPLMGFSQLGVFGARLASGQTKSTEPPNKVTDLRGPGHKFGQQAVGDVVLRFLRNKLAPIPGIVADALEPKYAPGATGVLADVAGKENLKGVKGFGIKAADKVVPISINDVYDAMKDQGVAKGTAISLLAILGMGTMLHEKRK